jgi:hypothetical protein
MNRGKPPVRPTRPVRRGVFGTFLEDASAVVESVAVEVAPGVVDALDVQAVIERIDLQAVLDRIDLNEVLERVDVNLLLDRVDISRVLVRLDPAAIVVLANALILQLDLNRAIDQLDMDRILAKIDMNAVVERMELGPIIAQAGSGITSEAVDAVRSAGVGLDDFVHGWVGRLLRRDGARPGGPRLLVHEPQAEPSGVEQ